MKKAVITLLGKISNSKPDYISEDGEIKKIFVDIKPEERAIYHFSNELKSFEDLQKQKRYINTLPLLIDIFSDRSIIPIATKKAKDIQKKTLESLKYDTKILENTIDIDEMDYSSIFQKISDLLNNDKYDSFVVDLTHGFRHLPILMIVNLIIASIQDIDKIEHIFFAKEIESTKEYEIIDLLDYIGLAKLAFVLQNFNANYTVGNGFQFVNETYQELADNLRIISNHLLANSIKILIESEENLISKTVDELEELKNSDKNVVIFTTFIDKIINHLKDLEKLKGEKEHIKLFELSKIMKDRDYLLNSITLLNESIGMYCAEILKKLDPKIEQHIDEYTKKERSNLYELAHQSKNFIKQQQEFSGAYLFNKNKMTAGQKKSLQKKKKELKSDIPQYVLSNIKKEGFKIELSKQDMQTQDPIKYLIREKLMQGDYSELIVLIEDIEKLRNNLSHGNSSEKIDNAKMEISKLIARYQKYLK